MIVRSEEEKEDFTEAHLQNAAQRIDRLNKEFFQNIELTDSENDALVWLCDFTDATTINNIISAFLKVTGSR